MEAQLPIVLLGAALALLGVGGGDWVVTKKDCTCKMCGGGKDGCGCGGSCACGPEGEKKSM